MVRLGRKVRKVTLGRREQQAQLERLVRADLRVLLQQLRGRRGQRDRVARLA